MTEDLREIAAFELPYRRKAELKEFGYDSGMKMLRLVLREGHRITQIELDAETATALADAMSDWAKAQG